MEKDKIEHPDCFYCGAKEKTDDFDGFGTYQYACGFMITRNDKVITPCPKDLDK